jgi:hypothetical protein
MKCLETSARSGTGAAQAPHGLAALACDRDGRVPHRLLTGFHVDNGRQLPLWDRLPHWTYWVLPARSVCR